MIGDESTSDRLRIELAAEAPSAKRARRLVERELTSWKCVQLVEVTVLLANELVTNSVLHAHSDIRLEVTKAPDGPGVRVEVSDHNVAPVSPRSASVHAEGGSGLDLVEGIFDEWGVERWDGGKPSGSRSFSNARHRSTRLAELCSRAQTISAAPAAANATMVR